MVRDISDWNVERRRKVETRAEYSYDRMEGWSEDSVKQ